MRDEILLQTQNLKKYYNRQQIRAVDGVSLQIRRGETLGLVGESGCGKSTLGRVILGMEKKTSGELAFGGSRMQVIFQNAAAAMNPNWKVRRILTEPLKRKRAGGSPESADQMAARVITQAGLKVSDLDKYPHQFSGGQKQRICIARALIDTPDFIVCDEPTAALDVSIQAQIIRLLQDMQKEYDSTYLFITHNLAVARYISDRIAVMYLGEIVEQACADELFECPQHPYTRMLLAAVPSIESPGHLLAPEEISDEDSDDAAENLMSGGCKFYGRCPERMERCRSERPELAQSGAHHRCACFKMS